MNGVCSGLKGGSGRAEGPSAGLRRNFDRALDAERRRNVGQAKRGHAGVEARQMALGVTTMVTNIAGGQMISVIVADDSNGDLIGQYIRRCLRTIAPH